MHADVVVPLSCKDVSVSTSLRRISANAAPSLPNMVCVSLYFEDEYGECGADFRASPDLTIGHYVEKMCKLYGNCRTRLVWKCKNRTVVPEETVADLWAEVGDNIRIDMTLANADSTVPLRHGDRSRKAQQTKKDQDNAVKTTWEALDRRGKVAKWESILGLSLQKVVQQTPDCILEVHLEHGWKFTQSDLICIFGDELCPRSA